MPLGLWHIACMTPAQTAGHHRPLAGTIVIPDLIYFSIPVSILFLILIFLFLFYSSFYLFFSSSFCSIPVSTFFYSISIPVIFSILFPHQFYATKLTGMILFSHCTATVSLRWAGQWLLASERRAVWRSTGHCIARPLSASQCILAEK